MLIPNLIQKGKQVLSIIFVYFLIFVSIYILYKPNTLKTYFKNFKIKFNAKGKYIQYNQFVPQLM